MKQEYTVDYFIEKFSAIPKSKWKTGHLTCKNGAKCALGHCGVREVDRENTTDQEVLDSLVGQNDDWLMTEEAIALSALFDRFGAKNGIFNALDAVYFTNDGEGAFDGYAKTPQERILKALNEIKEKNLV